jgi:hypothetical protein
MRLPIALTGLLLVSPAIHASEIELIPVTLGEARAAFPPDVFERNSAEAAKAGVDLAAEADRFVARGYADDRAYLLFYNHARAQGCPRDYLIQRVCLTKTRESRDGELATERSYLVEAMKLNNDQRTKKPDEHRKSYSRGESRRRTLIAEYEIGCGEVPAAAEGEAWPFDHDKLYRLIQNYTEDAGLYTQVRFDFSRVYRLEMEFDDGGRHSIIVPDFLPGD